MTQAPARVSIKDVARAAGVSIASVSRVINDGTGNVSPALRRKVEKAIADLNYSPNWIGQSLRGQTNNTYAMVISSIQNNFFSAVAWEIERRLNDVGTAMLLFNSNESPSLQDRCLEEIRSRQVAGVFMLCAVDSPKLEALSDQTPIVFINRRLQGMAGMPFVGIDDRSAAAELARAILREHQGRLAIIHGPRRSSTSAARLSGFRETFSRAGREVAEEDVSEAELSMEGGYTCAVGLLEPDRYAAVICGNDQIAYGVYRRCRELGIDVPGDIAIYGFDDNPLNQWLAPWLSTVRVPHVEYAEAAIETMTKIRDTGSATDKILPYDIVFRR